MWCMRIPHQYSPDESSYVLTHGLDLLTRTIYLVGSVDESMAFRLVASLDTLDASDGPIRIVLISGGGEEGSGFAIYDLIKMARNPTIIDCYGAVQSIAALMLQAGTVRRLSPEARFMIHNGHMELDGSVYQGTMVALARESKYLTTRYQEAFVARSGQTPRDIKRWCDDERYFSAEEAVTLGFADVVIQPTQQILKRLPTKATKKKRTR